MFLASLVGSAALAYEVQRQYLIHKFDLFLQEYDLQKQNQNFYHNLHEQVALNFNEKSQLKLDQENDLQRLREQLVGKADGIVLETCIGNGLNYPYYKMPRVKKIIGLDWV